MLCPNLLLPELISPNSFYEMLNKGKLSPNTINIFSSGLANNFGKLHRVFESICLTLARTFAENEGINYKKENCFELARLFRNSR